jgi:hypothetical protein
MAGLYFTAKSGDIAYTASTKTIVQVRAATNHRVIIDRIEIGFKGVSATDVPIAAEALTQSTDGTLTGALTTVYKQDDDAGETLQTTVYHTATSEPTGSNIKGVWILHPQTARSILFNPRHPLIVNGGDRLGIRVLSPAQSGTVNICLYGEE